MSSFADFLKNNDKKTTTSKNSFGDLLKSDSEQPKSNNKYMSGTLGLGRMDTDVTKALRDEPIKPTMTPIVSEKAKSQSSKQVELTPVESLFKKGYERDIRKVKEEAKKDKGKDISASIVKGLGDNAFIDVAKTGINTVFNALMPKGLEYNREKIQPTIDEYERVYKENRSEIAEGVGKGIGLGVLLATGEGALQGAGVMTDLGVKGLQATNITQQAVGEIGRGGISELALKVAQVGTGKYTPEEALKEMPKEIAFEIMGVGIGKVLSEKGLPLIKESIQKLTKEEISQGVEEATEQIIKQSDQMSEIGEETTEQVVEQTTKDVTEKSTKTFEDYLKGGEESSQKTFSEFLESDEVDETTEPLVTAINNQFRRADDTLKRTDEIKERGFSENIRTDEAMETGVRESFEVEPMNYEVLGNKTVEQSARDIFAKGYDEAIEHLRKTSDEFKPENVVLSRLIGNEAIRRGDKKIMREVLGNQAELLTSAGQTIQAAKILRESGDPITVGRYAQKQVDKVNKEGAKTFGKKWTDIQLTDEIIEKINKISPDNADDVNEKLIEEIGNDIASQLPVTRMEKLNSARRIFMLGNPKTHIRNIVGNSIMGGVKKVSDAVAEIGEKTLKQSERTKSFFKSDENIKKATKYFNENSDYILGETRYKTSGMDVPVGDKRIFKSDIMHSLSEFSKNTLEGEDKFFAKRHFISDLAGFMEARGLKEPTLEAVEYAKRRAEEATFREANNFAKALNKMKKIPVAGTMLDVKMPFVRTPANIAKLGIEYSPLGFLTSFIKKSRGSSASEFIESTAKALTGTGMASLGYYMANNGMVRGDYKRDSEEEGIEFAMGNLPNSIKLPSGDSYTIDWAQPIAIPYFMGVAFQEELEKQSMKENKNMVDAVLKGGYKGLDTIFEQSMLRGINDLFGGYGSIGEKIAGTPAEFFSQLIPTLSGQVARSVDPYKRERDYSGITSEFISSSKAKIPFASKTLPVKRDIFGEPMKYGNGFMNTVQQFLSPGYVGKESDDPIVKEMYRLYKTHGSDFLPRARVSSFTFNGEKYELSPQEKSDFQAIMGGFTKEKLENLGDSFLNMNDEAQMKIIKEINDVGREKAKIELLRERGVLGK